jgi:general secretion pathway protein A
LYTEYYGLIERPFELTPDQRYLYLSAHHREALAHLTYGVEERKGFVQLTGEVGTGKTTMLDALVVGLDASTKVARLAHTTIDEIDLLRILARGFGVELQGVKKSDMLAELGETLGAWTKQGRNAVFIVDEAQNLSLGVLEEIRLLSNLRANGRSSLQIVLAGQPELRAKLERRELRQLRQRIGIRYHLTPLSREETGEYIEHRLTVAGASRRIFDRGAIQTVYEYSRGVPRVINMICDRALLAGYAEGKATVGKELVLPTIEAIEGRAPEESPAVVSLQGAPVEAAPPRARRRWIIPALIVVAAVATTAYVVHGLGWRRASPVSERPEARVTEAVESAPVDDTGPGSGPGDAGATVLGDAQETADETEGDAPVVRQDEQEPDADTTRDRVEGGPEEAVESAVRPDERPPERDARAADGPAHGLVRGPGGPYAVVVASSRGEEAALAVVERLARDGFAAAVQPAELPSGLWYRVVLEGGYPTIGTARVAAESIGDYGNGDPWVLKR